MKQILQHLRQKWIKYLFETIAIIIGIIGAFSLDSWNEHRKERNEELLILKEISEDLTTGIHEIEQSNVVDHTSQLKRKVIILHMAHDLPYHDSLNWYFYNIASSVVPEFPSSGFEALKSKGFGLISNTALRREVIDVFDRIIIRVKESLIYDSRLRHERYLNSVYTKQFMLLSSELGDSVVENRIERLGTNSVIEPLNYSVLIKDQEYESLLREIYNNGVWMLKIKNDLAVKMGVLKDEIDAEIRRFQ